MNKNATYAIFGGSFDPPHLGHKEIVKKALDFVDKVIVVPTYLNPFKNSFNVSPKKRYNWAKEIFENKDVIVSDYEINQGKAVYSVDTIKELSKKYNIKAIIIGEDNLKNLHKWKDFEYLNNNFLWLIATRGKESKEYSKLKEYKLLPLNIDVSSTEIREGKKLGFLDKKIKKQVLIEYNINKKEN